jgi:hypothetical protein
MKLKSWVKYLVYVILIFFLVVLRGYVGKSISELYYKFENSSAIVYAVINLILGMCIGGLLGLEYLIGEFGKEGKWKVNLPKLILVGLPSLYVSLTYIYFFSGSVFILKRIVYPLTYLFKYGLDYVSLFQVILGYVVITSFYKCYEKV